jgi:hypothetical protein
MICATALLFTGAFKMSLHLNPLFLMNVRFNAQYDPTTCDLPLLIYADFPFFQLLMAQNNAQLCNLVYAFWPSRRILISLLISYWLADYTVERVVVTILKLYLLNNLSHIMHLFGSRSVLIWFNLVFGVNSEWNISWLLITVKADCS